DVGLLGCLSRVEWDELAANHFSGLLAEQYVAQHLSLFHGPLRTPELHYWLNDKKSHRAEVDFLLQTGSKVLPVEVKSGSPGQMKSLLTYLALHASVKRAIHLGPHSFSVGKLDYKLAQEKESVRVNRQLIQVPLYLVDRLKQIL
ncbi:MAG TPA: DUF4143 domain-containing protein, partial [Pseudobdellovibrionaceae bacterium]